MSGSEEILILGAGPAGLSCAYQLSRDGVASRLLERHDQVGGLCRTIPHKGYRFDVGPHRFFTKNEEVDRLWHDILGEDAVSVNRRTRILYNDHLFDYPLKPLSALAGLGPITSAKAMLAYMKVKAFPPDADSDNFEDWVVRQFGHVLYEIFFKTYTEKVWGIPCASISSAWAAQRIKGLSLGRAVMSGLLPWLNRGGKVKSLVDRFDYPRLGAGQVYTKMGEAAVAGGAQIDLHTAATSIIHEGSRVVAVESASASGETRTRVEHLFSSIPLTEFVLRLSPPPPDEVLEAARALYYRDHITVNLIVRRNDVFPDNWIYVHSPEVRVARISSYGNFSKEMLADPEKDALSVEYFAFAHEDLWQRRDDELVALATEEMARLELLSSADVEDGFVVRERDSYPTYYLAYKQHLETVKAYVARFANATLIGRGGMYRYNNQDHSVLSGLLAARNFQGGNYELWEINEEEEYLEEKHLPTPAHAGRGK